jgi:isopentenyl-diphosphate delta-isomerase
MIYQNDELLDIVNEQDQVIGQSYRSEVYAAKSVNFRAINGFIINDEGQLWIPRRTLNKRLFPLCLDASVGGHVESGESYEQAFEREIAEELNLDIKNFDYSLKGYLTPYNDKVSAFMKVYEIKLNTEPNYNKNDFIESYWLYPHEVIERIKNGDKSKNDLPKLIEKFYL